MNWKEWLRKYSLSMILIGIIVFFVAGSLGGHYIIIKFYNLLTGNSVQPITDFIFPSFLNPQQGTEENLTCNLNVTEYWYWNNETGQGYIVTDPETSCRLVSIYGEVENRAYYYYCDNVMEGFSHQLVLTNPETDFRLARTTKKCIRWE